MTKPIELSPVAVRMAIASAVRAIPPVWPLASSVAVNPFLGQSDRTLAETAALLARVAGIGVTMPRSWYAAKIAVGELTDDDIAQALGAAPANLRPASVAAIKSAAERLAPEPHRIPTVADLAAKANGTDWPRLVADRSGAWAAGYFDDGQALWAAPRTGGAYAAWRSMACVDPTPQIAGLRGFMRHVAEAPGGAEDAVFQASARLGLTDAAMPTYFHSLLMTLGGWAQVARYKLWQAELIGETDTTLVDLLAIRLVWEDALLRHCTDSIAPQWRRAVAAHGAPVSPNEDQIVDATLQQAAEQAAQRRLGDALASSPTVASTGRPVLQAVFCIDVRSEVFRRALEAIDPEIATLGFAGFFGLATSHRRFASDVEEHRLPVLLNPSVHSHSGANDEAERSARVLARARRAWGRFKLAAVSSFAFVEAMGPVYVMRLVRDTLGLVGRARPSDPAPRLQQGMDRGRTCWRGEHHPARDVAHWRLCTNCPHHRARREREEQSARERAPLRRVRRLFGGGQRASSRRAPQRSRCSGRACRERH